MRIKKQLLLFYLRRYAQINKFIFNFRLFYCCNVSRSRNALLRKLTL